MFFTFYWYMRLWQRLLMFLCFQKGTNFCHTPTLGLQANKMPRGELVCQLIRGPYATHSIFLWEVKIRLLHMIKPTLSTVSSWQKGIKYGSFPLGIPLSRAVGAYNVSAQDARVSARQIQPKGSILVSLWWRSPSGAPVTPHWHLRLREHCGRRGRKIVRTWGPGRSPRDGLSSARQGWCS